VKYASIALFATGLLLRADCPDGVYNYNASDLKFLTETYAALKAALPPAPEGWRMSDKGGPSFSGTFTCKGMQTEGLAVSYEVEYIWTAGEKELGLKLADINKRTAAIRRTPLSAEQQKLLTELGVKDRELRLQARKLATTDKAEADRLTREAAGYLKQMQEIRSEHSKSLQPQLEPLQQEELALSKSYSTKVGFSISVNGHGKPTGGQLVRSNAGTTELTYGTNITRGGKIDRIYKVTVSAKGDLKQAETLIARTNTETLKGLIGK